MSIETHPTSAKPLPLLVEEALSYCNPTKVKILLAAGVKADKITKIARGLTSQKELAEHNLDCGIRWKKGVKGKNSHQAILHQIFATEWNYETLETLEFFLSTGGNSHQIAACLASTAPPNEVEKRIRFLDLLRRILSLEEQHLKGATSPLEIEKGSHLTRLISQKRAISDCKEGFEEIRTLFKRYVKEADEAEMIHGACKLGLKKLVIELLKLDLDINVPHAGNGFTPLHAAAWFGNEELLEWLLDHGAHIDARTPEKNDAAAQCPLGGETPLHLACSRGNMRVIESLLRRGADPEAMTAAGNRPLHYVCNKNEAGNNEELAHLFIGREVDLNAKNYRGWTPLHYACLEGYSGLVKYLLASGANPGALARWNESPFHVSIHRQRRKFILDFFCNFPAVAEAVKAVGVKKLLPYLRQNPEKLVVGKEDFSVRNPLEFAFLFNDSEIARFLKFRLSARDYRAALEELEKKYPHQTFDILINSGAVLKDSIVYRMGNNNIPSLPSLELSMVKKIFENIEFFYSEKLESLEKEEVAIDSEGNLLRRRVVEVLKEEGEIERQTLATLAIRAEELIRVELDKITFDASGCSIAEGKHLRYLIAKIGETMLPVAIEKKGDITAVEIRVEMLKALLSKINFTDANADGFRDPETIVDSGSSKNSEPIRVSPEQLKIGLKSLCDAVNFRIPYVGTPSEKEPEKLKKWYGELELLIKHLLIASFKEDPKSERQSNGQEEERDPTPWASTVIELSIAGLHCGGRLFDDAKYLYDIKFGEPETLQDKLLERIERLKFGIAHEMVNHNSLHNLHIKNKILQVIDEAFGIPDEEKAKRYYFNDSIAPKSIDRERIERNFRRNFSSVAIIDRIDQAVNGEHSEICRDLIIDWFKDNIADDWTEKFNKITLGLEKHQTNEAKACYLNEYDIYIHPSEFKNEKEPNWNQIIEEAKKYLYIEKRVQNQMTGKIKREALAALLEQCGVFK